MDQNDLRSIITVLTFMVFVGIVLWAWSARRRAAFDEAARLPFTEDEILSPSPVSRAGEGSAALAAQLNGFQGKTS